MNAQLTTLNPQPATLTSADAATRIKSQYEAVVAAENNAFRQRVILGGMLLQWEQYLGLSKGGYGTTGEGLKGWLEENIPELGYAQARGYKEQAKKVIAMLGGGPRAVAALMGGDTAINPSGCEEPIDAEIIEKRDEIFENIDSRRKLEQSYFAFMSFAMKGHAGRPVGTGPAANLQALSQVSVVEAMFRDLTKIMAEMRKHGPVLMKNAAAIRAKHPNECADFAQVAWDFAKSFGK